MILYYQYGPPTSGMTSQVNTGMLPSEPWSCCKVLSSKTWGPTMLDMKGTAGLPPHPLRLLSLFMSVCAVFKGQLGRVGPQAMSACLQSINGLLFKFPRIQGSETEGARAACQTARLLPCALPGGTCWQKRKVVSYELFPSYSSC